MSTTLHTMKISSRPLNVIANPHKMSFASSVLSTKNGYADLTGRFPFPSSRGNNYVMIMYDYDSNAILAEPVKNRQTGELKTEFLTMYTKLANRGRSPNLFILDNKCSYELKQALTKNKLKYQLAPPYKHQRNAAERAIQTFKKHFIAGLSSTHPEFPICGWDRLIEQVLITLNLLRNSRIDPKLSAQAFLY